MRQPRKEQSKVCPADPARAERSVGDYHKGRIFAGVARFCGAHDKQRETGAAKGGNGDGSFSATLYGDLTAGADGIFPQPAAVVGEFNAGFSNGSVAGAFGATKD